jgi:hypothetical protein
VTFQNSGGSGLGLRAVLWGTGLDLIDTSEVSVVTRTSGSAAPDIRTVPLVRTLSTDAGVPILYAEIPDFAMPMGFVNPAGPPGAIALPQRGMTIRRMFDLQAAASVALVLSGTGAKAGEGELNVGAVPLQNRDAGQTSWTLKVIVSETTA